MAPWNGKIRGRRGGADLVHDKLETGFGGLAAHTFVCTETSSRIGVAIGVAPVAG